MFGGLFKKKDNKMILGAPVKGKAVPLSEVNDPTFAEEMLGKGMAVIPAEGKIYAPADGEIGMVFDTLHAVSLVSEEGTEILIHVGLDTVKMNGEGFTGHVKAGDKVKKGDLLLEVDLDKVKAAGYDKPEMTQSLSKNRRGCCLKAAYNLDFDRNHDRLK